MSSKDDLKYYVYAYLRDDGTPYYIGKGVGRRAWDGSSHVVKPKKDKNNIKIIISGISEKRALAIEKYYIREYGRKDLSTGILHNRTNGGETSFGFKHSEEYKESKSSKWTIVTPEGSILYISNLTGFCRDNKLDQAAMYRVSRGTVKHHKKYKCLIGWDHNKTLLEPVKSLSRRYKLIDADGNVHITDSLFKFANERGLDNGNLNKVVHGKKKDYKGWTGVILHG